MPQNILFFPPLNMGSFEKWCLPLFAVCSAKYSRTGLAKKKSWGGKKCQNLQIFSGTQTARPSGAFVNIQSQSNPSLNRIFCQTFFFRRAKIGREKKLEGETGKTRLSTNSKSPLRIPDHGHIARVSVSHSQILDSELGFLIAWYHGCQGERRMEGRKFFSIPSASREKKESFARHFTFLLIEFRRHLLAWFSRRDKSQVIYNNWYCEKKQKLLCLDWSNHSLPSAFAKKRLEKHQRRERNREK